MAIWLICSSMSTFFSSLLSRCSMVCSLWLHRPYRAGDRAANGHNPLNDEEGHEEYGATPKRRALLVGISYSLTSSETWSPLDGTHTDVDNFRELLINTYEYSPEDIIILKDDLKLPDLSQPTRVNMLRELRRLVSGAASGDRFTFLYSGHSDQQPSLDSLEVEEDGKDEVIITCDEQRIIDNELKEILVDNLPVGCSLFAILDTCHSGTMLDLPHHRCNSVYVPWLSRGSRRTKTMHNKIVRGCALGLVGPPDLAFWRPRSIASVMSINNRRPTDTYSEPSLRINTKICSFSSTDQRRMSVEVDSRQVRGSWEYTSVLSPTRTQCDSPLSGVRCDGWCRYDPFPHATVVSLSACDDPQQAWEGPRGSLTAVLCNFFKLDPWPSYRTLMSHVNFQLHANCRALHQYTLDEKKKAERGEGPGFDGEFNNFQEPQLSSLAKLNMDEIVRL
ncbi:caspase domain-containing protein [Russula compacta]|nr:caspase domain-containing protein [Russula compacta]